MGHRRLSDTRLAQSAEAQVSLPVGPAETYAAKSDQQSGAGRLGGKHPKQRPKPELDRHAEASPKQLELVALQNTYQPEQPGPSLHLKRSGSLGHCPVAGLAESAIVCHSRNLAAPRSLADPSPGPTSGTSAAIESSIPKGGEAAAGKVPLAPCRSPLATPSPSECNLSTSSKACGQVAVLRFEETDLLQMLAALKRVSAARAGGLDRWSETADEASGADAVKARDSHPAEAPPAAGNLGPSIAPPPAGAACDRSKESEQS